jgi:hypothetical protein
VFFKRFPACSAEPLTVLLEALLDGVITICQLLSAKPRSVARASLLLLQGASAGLRPCVATYQNQH